MNDTRHNIEKLKKELSHMRYKGTIDLEKALKGHSSVFLPIIHFSLLIYSKPVAQFINDQGFELFGQNDYQFINSGYEILNLLFKYKPSFNIDQFFATGMAERKITFALDLLGLIKSKHTVLNKRSSSLKPKSVTFRDEEEQASPFTQSCRDKKHFALDMTPKNQG